jgi:glycerol-3-phosphate dehydrogenase
MNRPHILESVRARTDAWDIIVIGGGATGVGCALDAASRGFSVLLVEAHDFGKGTSSRSTKLVHGGVRYLAQGRISLVREGLTERTRLLRNAPHVVHKQSFIVPCYSQWQKLYYGAGLKIYDLIARGGGLGKSRVLSKKETLERLPTVNPRGLTGGIVYQDGQFDDTRLLIDLVRTAETYGADVLNYARVTSLIKTAGGKIQGVEFEDVLTGEPMSATAKVVINATGAFCDRLRGMSDETAVPMVTYSQGIHLVFDRRFLPTDDAILIPKTSDGRVLFCIPWLGATLVGTTDTPIDSPEIEPLALESEIAFVLENAGKYLAKRPSRPDILSVFAGVRPLVNKGNTLNTASISRGHAIEIDRSGLVTITGGKWTTYRRMAEEAIDHAVRLAHLGTRPSITATIAIAGTETVRDDGDPLHPDLPYTAADVVTAVRQEMAQTVEDVLARRTRALFLNARAAVEMAPAVAAIMAAEFGADLDWVTRQISQFSEMARGYVAVPPSGPGKGD